MPDTPAIDRAHSRADAGHSGSRQGALDADAGTRQVWQCRARRCATRWRTFSDAAPAPATRPGSNRTRRLVIAGSKVIRSVRLQPDLTERIRGYGQSNTECNRLDWNGHGPRGRWHPFRLPRQGAVRVLPGV